MLHQVFRRRSAAHPPSSNPPQPSASHSTPSSFRSLTPELLEFDDLSSISHSLCSLTSLISSTPSIPEPSSTHTAHDQPARIVESGAAEEQEDEEEEEEDSSDVTINRPIRPSDYLVRISLSAPSPNPNTTKRSLTTVAQTSIESPPPDTPKLSTQLASQANRGSTSPPPSSTSSLIECQGSPMSLSSWPPSEPPSRLGSSVGACSIFGDPDHFPSEHEIEDLDLSPQEEPSISGDAEDMSDCDLGPEASPTGRKRPRAEFRSSAPSREYLDSVTDHLVMPRLSIQASSSNLSSPASSSRGVSSRPGSVNSLRRGALGHTFRDKHPQPGTSHTPITHLPNLSLNKPLPLGSIARILLIGDLDNSPSFNALDISMASFADHIDRANEIVPGFQISDPTKHEALLRHISTPFMRLRSLLDPSVLDYPNLPSSRHGDLIRLVDSWVAREAYTVAFVEMKEFPATSDTLDFILALSRLVPIIPFISSTLLAISPMDSYAVLSRQLGAKRVHHFPLPNPFRAYPLPDPTECVKRSRKCCLDWLAVEQAARAEIPRQHSVTSREPPGRFPPVHEDSEPDRWSEKVNRRMRSLALDPHEFAGHTPNTVSLKRIQSYQSSPAHSDDPIGFPPISYVIQVGLSRLSRGIGNLLRGLIIRILHLGSQSPPPAVSLHQEWVSTPNEEVLHKPKDSNGPSAWLVVISSATAATVLTVWGYSILCS